MTHSSCAALREAAELLRDVVKQNPDMELPLIVVHLLEILDERLNRPHACASAPATPSVMRIRQAVKAIDNLGEALEASGLQWKSPKMDDTVRHCYAELQTAALELEAAKNDHESVLVGHQPRLDDEGKK